MVYCVKRIRKVHQTSSVIFFLVKRYFTLFSRWLESMLRAKTLFRSFSLTWCTICFSIIISNILETLGRKINLFYGLYLIGLMLAKFEFCKKNYFSNISEFHLSAKFQSSEDSFTTFTAIFPNVSDFWGLNSKISLSISVQVISKFH